MCQAKGWTRRPQETSLHSKVAVDKEKGSRERPTLGGTKEGALKANMPPPNLTRHYYLSGGTAGSTTSEV